MCFSEKVSWLTLIIGTIINIISLIFLSKIPNPRVIIPIMLIIGWQYALLMQIPDALAWRDLKSPYPGKLAFVLNTTQPLIAIMMVAFILHKLGVSLVRLAPAIIVCAVYIVYVLIEAFKTDYIVKPRGSCHNLEYTWWDNIPYALYSLIMILAVLCIPSIPYVVLTLALFCGSIAATRMVVDIGCDPGSLWCWSVAGAGLITALSSFVILK